MNCGDRKKDDRTEDSHDSERALPVFSHMATRFPFESPSVEASLRGTTERREKFNSKRDSC
jgi:hypothetical protein